MYFVPRTFVLEVNLILRNTNAIGKKCNLYPNLSKAQKIIGRKNKLICCFKQSVCSKMYTFSSMSKRLAENYFVTIAELVHLMPSFRT